MNDKFAVDNTKFYFTIKNRKIKRILSKQSLLPSSKRFCPIIILGESASGKTAFANMLLHDYKVAKLNPAKITCEWLLNELVSSIKADISIDTIVHRYEVYDVLVVDEIEDLSWKNSTQEYVAEFIKMLSEKNVQVVLMGIEKYDDCLMSLFSVLEHYKLYNLEPLSRIDRIIYIEKD